jgi:hypothetical protein
VLRALLLQQFPMSQSTGQPQTAELLQLMMFASGACLLQEVEDDEEGWEDVAAPGIAAAGANSQGGLLASVPDDDDEDWEDVL